jgi:hypothetical protein
MDPALHLVMEQLSKMSTELKNDTNMGQNKISIDISAGQE